MARKPNSAPDHYAKGYRLADHCVARRPCLGPCGKSFLSMGAGNRICPKCEARNSRVFLSKGER